MENHGRAEDWQTPRTEKLTAKPKSAFDPESLGPVILIMLMRLYDLNLAWLSVVDEEKAQKIRVLHERGQTFAPPPKFVPYEEPDEVS
jgi:hypothetical protein